MGFNEPDRADQADLTPRPRFLCGTKSNNTSRPKTGCSGTESRKPDLARRFRNGYITVYGTPPRFDALAVHCYFPSAAACIQYVETFKGWAKAWGVKEIWNTEFAFFSCSKTADQAVLQEGQALIEWLENEPMVTHYAWYTNRVQGTESWHPVYDPGAELDY